jgi:hypothetical protein
MTSIGRVNRHVIMIAAGIVAFAGGYVITIANRPPRDQYPGGLAVQNGSEVVMFYLSSGDCGACAAPELPAIVKGLKVTLREYALQKGMGFSAVAVGVQHSPYAAVDHLRKFGKFDELGVGRSWLNSLAVDYISQRVPGTPAIPQVLVIRRNVEGPPRILFRISDEQVLARYVGIDELRRWLNRGAPLAEHSG